MATTKGKTIRKPADVHDVFRQALSQAQCADELRHLERLRDAALELVAAVSMALEGEPATCEQESWEWCLAQVDEVNKSMMRRCAMFRELRHVDVAVPYPDTIPF